MRRRAGSRPVTPPPGFACPRCGGTQWRAERPAFLGSVGRWLTPGPPFRPSSTVCASCGYRPSGMAFAVYGFSTLRRVPRPVRALTLPLRVARVLACRRMATPNPIMYVLGASVGAVVGVGLRFAFGWHWWSVAVAATVGVVVTWLVFMATALPRFGGSPHGSLWGDVVRTVSPRRAHQRAERSEAAMFACPPFALFGLPASWGGLRMAGGRSWSGRGRAPSAIELLHGDPGPDG